MWDSELPVPGPAMTCVLESTDVGELVDGEVVGYLRACEREIARASARSWRAASLVADRVQARVTRSPGFAAETAWRGIDGSSLAFRLAVDEVAAGLRISRASATRRIELGEALRGPLARVGALLDDGAISVAHALVIFEHTRGRSAALVSDLLDLTLKHASVQSPAGLGKSLIRAEARLDPAGVSARRAAAVRERTGVRQYSSREGDGTGSLVITADDPSMAWAYDVLDTLADARLRTEDEARRAASSAEDDGGHAGRTRGSTDGGEIGSEATGAETVPVAATDSAEPVDESGVPGWPGRRTGEYPCPEANGDSLGSVDESGVPGRSTSSAGLSRAQRRAHARVAVFLDLLANAADAPAFPTRHGRARIHTKVVIDLPTLLGLREDPGEINGRPVPGPVVRMLADQGSVFSRLVTAPVTGHLLDVSPAYAPDQALTDYLIARDRTCAAPTCQVSAQAGDLDHLIPHAQCKTTNPANLRATCRGHHSGKTLGLVETIPGPAGAIDPTWRTVLGHSHGIPVRPVLPDPPGDVTSTQNHAQRHAA